MTRLSVRAIMSSSGIIGLAAVLYAAVATPSVVNAARTSRALLSGNQQCQCEVTPDSCCFYEHNYYQGCAYGPYVWSDRDSDFAISVGPAANDRFSSMKCGSNVYAEVQQHDTPTKNQGGRTIALIANEPDFGKFGFQDQTSAVYIKRINGVAVIRRGQDHLGRANSFAIAGEGRWWADRIRKQFGFEENVIDEVVVPSGRSITLYWDDIDRYSINFPGRGRYNGGVGEIISRKQVIERTFGPGRHDLDDFSQTIATDLEFLHVAIPGSPNPGAVYRVRQAAEFSWANEASAWIVHGSPSKPRQGPVDLATLLG